MAKQKNNLAIVIHALNGEVDGMFVSRRTATETIRQSFSRMNDNAPGNGPKFLYMSAVVSTFVKL